MTKPPPNYLWDAARCCLRLLHPSFITPRPPRYFMLFVFDLNSIASHYTSGCNTVYLPNVAQLPISRPIHNRHISKSVPTHRMARLSSATRLATVEDDADPPEQASAPWSPFLVRCLQPPTTQYTRDAVHHGHADNDRSATTATGESRFSYLLKKGFHPTLTAVIGEVNRLLLFFINVIDAPVLTTDTHGHSCHQKLLARNEGPDHTVVLRINLPTIANFLKRFDASTLQVQSLLFINVAYAFSHSQVLRCTTGALEIATNLPNAPPPRPAPKPYPTGPHQSGILKPKSALTSLESTRIFEAGGLCRQRRDNKPPPRPAPNLYPTGPHQSSIKRPNKPPPRPAPKPYPTGPHQS